MKIEVWQGKSVKNRQSWFWHLRQSNGRVTLDAEAYPSKSNAVRAAKAAVKAIIKQVMPPEWHHPQFSKLTPNEKTGGFEFMWY